MFLLIILAAHVTPEYIQSQLSNSTFIENRYLTQHIEQHEHTPPERCLPRALLAQLATRQKYEKYSTNDLYIYIPIGTSQKARTNFLTERDVNQIYESRYYTDLDQTTNSDQPKLFLINEKYNQLNYFLVMPKPIPQAPQPAFPMPAVI